METETVTNALIGGGLIGLASAALLLLTGKVAGISGILYGLLTNEKGQRAWKLSFVLGMVAAGLVLGWLYPPAFMETPMRRMPTFIAAGILIGFGARLGGGCTSGHGICGVARLSARSITASLAWVISGALVLWITKTIAES